MAIESIQNAFYGSLWWWIFPETPEKLSKCVYKNEALALLICVADRKQRLVCLCQKANCKLSTTRACFLSDTKQQQMQIGLDYFGDVAAIWRESRLKWILKF